MAINIANIQVRALLTYYFFFTATEPQQNSEGGDSGRKYSDTGLYGILLTCCFFFTGPAKLRRKPSSQLRNDQHNISTDLVPFLYRP